MKPYTIRRCRQILKNAYKRYQKKKPSLPEETQRTLRKALLDLQTSILGNDKTRAKHNAQHVKKLFHKHCKKTFFEQSAEMLFGLAFALALASLIRPMVFELYEVPTGSMRPSIQEKDRLFVSKTHFGINIPFVPKHLTFDPNLVQRGGTVVFTGENLDIHDVDTWNFYLIPGKKQLVKRLIAKPGDTLYFYGGKIYGFDDQGNDISNALNPKLLSYVHHIPFITLEGKVKTPSSNGISSPTVFRQMNMPVARLDAISQDFVRGELLNKAGEHLYDYWGMGNYAMVRILTDKQYQAMTGSQAEAPAYLEIQHHANTYEAYVERDRAGRIRPHLGVFTSYLALDTVHLQRLMEHMTTTRFTAKEGRLFPYSFQKLPDHIVHFVPKLEDIPDGTYEFYNGTAYRIGFGGIQHKLPKQHPLYTCTTQRAQLLFNLGVDFLTIYEPSRHNHPPFPPRYAYYKNGDLYLLDHPILQKDDPNLLAFLQSEHLKEQTATTIRPYAPFKDSGLPSRATIAKHGLTIPKGHYLVLGDNYAASADSRDFGFLPESNIRGAPSFIFWPPGPRFSGPVQPPYPWLPWPRIIVLGTLLIVIGGWSFISRKRNQLPLPIE